MLDVQESGAGAKRRLPAAARKVDTLTELLVISDIVSLHCRITRDTVQLINGDALRSMKSGTWFFTWIRIERLWFAMACGKCFRGTSLEGYFLSEDFERETTLKLLNL